MTQPQAAALPIVARLTPEELAQAVRGVLTHRGSAETIGLVCTDTRKLAPGQTFWAVVGDRFDGHSFVERAAHAGASGVVVQRGQGPADPGDAFVVEVEDTTTALGDLAAAILVKKRKAAPRFKVLAITGSNGKTTTKEMLAAVLGTHLPLLKTEGNFNNWIGLPLTVFRLTDEHEAAVLEMGANAHGEIRRLREIARPDTCILTSLAAAHLEGFESIEGVARAKGEIFEGDEAQRFVLPAEFVGRFSRLEGDARVVTVARPESGQSAHLWVEAVEATPNGVSAQYRWARAADGTCDAQATVEVPLLGEHNALNFGLVVAALLPLGLGEEQLQAGASALRLPPGRLEVHRYADDIEVLQDAYNANPASMRAAMAVLAQRAEPRHRIAVLGEMRELGASSTSLHAAIGVDAAKVAPKLLVAVGGPDAEALAEAARASGVANVHTVPIADVEAVVSLLQKTLVPGDVVLLKGSRAVALERVAAGLRAARGGK